LLECSINLLKYKKKKEKVLSLTAIDLLKSTVGDDAFGNRITANFDLVVEKISESVQSLKMPDFFDYLEEFIYAHHGNFTTLNLQILLKSLVSKIIEEQKNIEVIKKPKKTLNLGKKEIVQHKPKMNEKQCVHRIAKCWCVIRYIAEHEFFTGANFI
jgi:hypothetical protein